MIPKLSKEERAIKCGINDIVDSFTRYYLSIFMGALVIGRVIAGFTTYPVITRVKQGGSWFGGKPARTITMIRPSPKLSDWFPLRAFDYDNDGLVDKVEKYFHGAPRVPYGVWIEVPEESELFGKVAIEYAGAYRNYGREE